MSHLEAVHTAPLRPDTWSASNAQCRARFQLVAEAEPDLICRVLNLFAMQYLIPQQVSVQREEDRLMIETEVDGLSWHRAQVIAEKMRSLIDVCSVELAPVTDLHVLTEPMSRAAC
jgi:hypothetical protein